jgi:hypothetical protein
MLLPFVVYAGPCDGVVADAAAVRTGKGEGDRRNNAFIRSRFFGGCGVKLISECTWIFPPYANCSGALFFLEEVNESGRIEAIMITLLTSRATARRRQGAGKTRSLDALAATRNMQEDGYVQQPLTVQTYGHPLAPEIPWPIRACEGDVSEQSHLGNRRRSKSRSLELRNANVVVKALRSISAPGW